ncbi:hypothetical protein E2E30_12605 [Sphingomonas sp. AAP5]|uniref:hypothetical protein n=1 Tax=Sphingomonas sp. AAP5 TaxID=1523415 RepID=UPI001056F551|nr:hypothetical protein [Sphingomonas sp. AAP5]QBM76524.1 hypothetical protein E2E30_12605 [Sphingomonas sp. AAP5]
MAEYRDTTEKVYVEKKSNTGMVIGTIIVLALVVVGVLFATGFWSADVKGGEMPKINVSAKEGALPDVDVKSKEVVVGTKKTTVDVPTVGVKDDDK